MQSLAVEQSKWKLIPLRAFAKAGRCRCLQRSRLRRGPAETLGPKNQDGRLGTPLLPVPGGAGRALAGIVSGCRGAVGRTGTRSLPCPPSTAAAPCSESPRGHVLCRGGAEPKLPPWLHVTGAALGLGGNRCINYPDNTVEVLAGAAIIIISCHLCVFLFLQLLAIKSL